MSAERYHFFCLLPYNIISNKGIYEVQKDLILVLSLWFNVQSCYHHQSFAVTKSVKPSIIILPITNRINILVTYLTSILDSAFIIVCGNHVELQQMIEFRRNKTNNIEIIISKSSLLLVYRFNETNKKIIILRTN